MLSGTKKPTRHNPPYLNFNNTNQSEQEEKVIQDILSNIQIDISTPTSQNKNDDSIIDVTNYTYENNYNVGLKQHIGGVPYWEHQYVYSYSEIKEASDKQKKFYFFFKNNFLNGIYLDLDGNTNYAFILLFNLLEEYESHRDISKLEKQIKALGQHYTKTKSYGNSFLIKKMNLLGYNEGVARIQEENRFSYQNYNADYDYWKLGNKYKNKLKLDEEAVNLLNKLWNPYNNFCNIEYCLLEILKLYIAVIIELKEIYIQNGTTLENEFSIVSDVIARKHYKYRKGSQNYKYSIESITNELYLKIFRYSENSIREFYGHKRKLTTDIYYIKEAKIEYESRIISKITELLSVLIHKVASPDEATEIELYAQNTTRWKIKFEELTTNYKGNSTEFVNSIISLGKLNEQNLSVENVFFEASKFMAKYDKESSLSLYLYYLHYDLKSATFVNKQLSKTLQKSLFTTSEQHCDFEVIVSEYIKDKNLEKALQEVPKIYVAKRKKIQLDRHSILEVLQQHSGTVELLNEYLKDDEDSDSQIEEQHNEKLQIEIISSKYESGIAFSQMQIATLNFFEENNFSLLQNDFENFSKSNGVLKNQLIENINDICYESLDDILIEEDEEYYTINKEYYQQILAK